MSVCTCMAVYVLYIGPQVRRSGRITLKRTPHDVLRLARVPAHRAFSNIVELQLQLNPRTATRDKPLYVEAVAAAAAAWPRLERVELGEVMDIDSDDDYDCDGNPRYNEWGYYSSRDEL